VAAGEWGRDGFVGEKTAEAWIVSLKPAGQGSGVRCLRRIVAVLSLFLTRAAVAFAMGQLILANSYADDRPRQLIEALANRNEEPKVVECDGLTFTLFSPKYDWAEDKRVQSAISTLARDENEALWQHLTQCIDDKRYSFSVGEQPLWAHVWSVGHVCRQIAKKRLLCAYLQHLEPGKTTPYGGNSSNFVSDDSKEFLPGGLQADLHYPRQLDNTTSDDPRDHFKSWCQARKGKPLYELPIEMCEWAVTKAENCRNAEEEPKRRFVDAVKKQIALLKDAKKPVIDRSATNSPLLMYQGSRTFYEEEATRGWKIYRKTLAEMKQE
jgi:hypothetical protein